MPRSPKTRACGGWPERDIFIMGPVHLDYVAYNGLVHKLHAATKKDTGRA
jgi:hypothetical protein